MAIQKLQHGIDAIVYWLEMMAGSEAAVGVELLYMKNSICGVQEGDEKMG